MELGASVVRQSREGETERRSASFSQHASERAFTNGIYLGGRREANRRRRRGRQEAIR